MTETIPPTNPRPLRVLHLTPRLTRAAGGAWHYVSGLAGGLERVGVCCVVAGVAEPGNRDAAMLTATRVITGAPTILPANYGFSRELSRRVASEVEDVDLVHAHGFRVGTDLLAMRVGRKLDVPILLSPHGQLHPAIAGRSPWKKAFPHLLWGRRYERIVAAALGVSDVEADVIRAALPDKPVHSLPIGIDVEAYRVGKNGHLARVAPETAGKRILLYLAYMHSNKGVDRLADAWLALHRERRDWHLVLAGVDVNGLGAATAQRLRDAGAGESFTLLGPAFDQEKRNLFADAELFTMPSDAESFGIAFAESLASGVPVIATRGAPWSSVVDRGCGWWIEPTVDALTATLRAATALDAATLAAMGDRGRRLVQERFDWRPIASAVRRLYEELIRLRSEAKGHR